MFCTLSNPYNTAYPSMLLASMLSYLTVVRRVLRQSVTTSASFTCPCIAFTSDGDMPGRRQYSHHLYSPPSSIHGQRPMYRISLPSVDISLRILSFRFSSTVSTDIIQKMPMVM